MKRKNRWTKQLFWPIAAIFCIALDVFVVSNSLA
jgi:hypothetical protein